MAGKVHPLGNPAYLRTINLIEKFEDWVGYYEGFCGGVPGFPTPDIAALKAELQTLYNIERLMREGAVIGGAHVRWIGPRVRARGDDWCRIRRVVAETFD